MAGYLFGLDSQETLHECISRGCYSTVMSQPKDGIWGAPQEGTFADYASMQEGDNVYFFIQRKIYGIGRLVRIADKDCKFCNYPKASVPNRHRYNEQKPLLLIDNQWPSGKTQRWICTFNPSPHFFRNGVDMDDVLASNPSAFKMFRAFWKRSFIKIDDVENQALIDILLRKNQEAINTAENGHLIFPFSKAFLREVSKKVVSGQYKLDAGSLLCAATHGDRIKHEMAIEAAILYQLSSQEKAAVSAFGNWDYLSHQVIASPFKPIDYMDKMDVFGYSYIHGYKPTKSKYLVMEIKKDRVVQKDVEQLMKYVDWVKDEYCHGDYSMVQAFLVGNSFEKDLSEYVSQSVIRRYVVGTRPAESRSWSNVSLIEYSYNDETQLLNFRIHH